MITLPTHTPFVYMGPAEWESLKPSERKREPRYEVTRHLGPCSARDRLHVEVRGRDGNAKRWCVPNLAPVVVIEQATEKAA